MEVLKCSITDANNLLTICGNQSSSIHIELSTCHSISDNYLRTIEENLGKLRISETAIIQLGNDNSSLAAGKKQCEADLSTLRCEMKKYLEKVKQTQAAAYQKILEAFSISNETKPKIDAFIVDKKLTCPNA